MARPSSVARLASLAGVALLMLSFASSALAQKRPSQPQAGGNSGNSPGSGGTTSPGGGSGGKPTTTGGGSARPRAGGFVVK